MSKQNKDKSISEPSELDHKIKKADPMIREAISGELGVGPRISVLTAERARGSL